MRDSGKLKEKLLQVIPRMARKGMFQKTAATAVANAVSVIAAIKNFSDTGEVERAVIALGLNDESLREQPVELREHFGKGLHLWQYPIQLGKYLSWLATHAADITSYVEIGSRWGGTLIAVCETLRRNCKGCLTRILAVDPVGETPLLAEYRAYLATQTHTGSTVLEFYKGLSSAPEFKRQMLYTNPSCVFIDGDHRYMAALEDHELADAAGEQALSAASADSAVQQVNRL
jgi:hypothetical protein